MTPSRSQKTQPLRGGDECAASQWLPRDPTQPLLGCSKCDKLSRLRQMGGAFPGCGERSGLCSQPASTPSQPRQCRITTPAVYRSTNNSAAEARQSGDKGQINEHGRSVCIQCQANAARPPVIQAVYDVFFLNRPNGKPSCPRLALPPSHGTSGVPKERPPRGHIL